jgi:hypothetical protein
MASDSLLRELLLKDTGSRGDIPQEASKAVSGDAGLRLGGRQAPGVEGGRGLIVANRDNPTCCHLSGVLARKAGFPPERSPAMSGGSRAFWSGSNFRAFHLIELLCAISIILLEHNLAQ